MDLFCTWQTWYETDVSTKLHALNFSLKAFVSFVSDFQFTVRSAFNFLEMALAWYFVLGCFVHFYINSSNFLIEMWTMSKLIGHLCCHSNIYPTSQINNACYLVVYYSTCGLMLKTRETEIHKNMIEVWGSVQQFC